MFFRTAFLLALLPLAAGCGRRSSGGVAPAPTATATVRFFPLEGLSVTFSTNDMQGADAFVLTPDRSFVHQRNGREIGRTRVSVRELGPLRAALSDPALPEASKPSRLEVGDVPHFHFKLTSPSKTLDAEGPFFDGDEYKTPRPIVDVFNEMTKLGDKIGAPARGDFSVLATFTQQGGTVGHRDIIDVRSGGAIERRDWEKVIGRGTVPADELAPLARLLASPELAVLGPSFVDRTPPPNVIQDDYRIEISGGVLLVGCEHPKMPDVVDALMREITSLRSFATAAPTSPANTP